MAAYLDVARLRWRLRRGTKELDIFFEALLAQGLEALPADEVNSLQQLAELPDPEILALLNASSHAPPPYTAAINCLRKAIRQAHPTSTG